MEASNRRVARACDACKARKVKCNGEARCSQCAHTGLRCIYTAAAKPRHQGRRGRVISEYKRQTSSGTVGVLAPLLPRKEGPVFDAKYFLALLPDYMASVYPVQPVLTEEEIRESVEAMEVDKEAYAYVHAFAACTLNLTYIGGRRTAEIAQTIETLIDECIRNRPLVNSRFKPSVRQCMIPLHLHNCSMTMRNSPVSFYYMREAVCMIQLLEIDVPERLAGLSPPEKAKRQRLYWEAYVHERFLAILDYRQAIMRPLQELPDDDPTIPVGIQEGFNQILRLFRLLDTDFLQNWLGHHESTVTPAWIESKHAQLDQHLDSPTGNPNDVLTTMQKADLVVTKQWLKTLVWRLAMSNTLLSSSSPKECLSLLFPVRLSTRLRHQVSTTPREDIEIHGSGIVQKLFEITDTIADVIIAVPALSMQDTANRVDDFLFLLHYLFTFPTLDHTCKDILTEKLGKLQNLFPQQTGGRGGGGNGGGGGGSSASPSIRQNSFPGTAGALDGDGAASVCGPDDPWYGVTESMLPIMMTSPQGTASTLSGMDDFPMPIPLPINGGLHSQYDEISRRLSAAEYVWPKEEMEQRRL